MAGLVYNVTNKEVHKKYAYSSRLARRWFSWVQYHARLLVQVIAVTFEAKFRKNSGQVAESNYLC
jgi:hypothetical protein